MSMFYFVNMLLYCMQTIFHVMHVNCINKSSNTCQFSMITRNPHCHGNPLQFTPTA